MSGRARRTRRKPCPSWCRRHIEIPGGPVHLRLAAVIERPERELTPMEELTAKHLGRRPGYVEVEAMQIKDRPAEVQLTVAGTAATLTADEAMRVGQSLMALGIEISAAIRVNSPDGT